MKSEPPIRLLQGRAVFDVREKRRITISSTFQSGYALISVSRLLVRFPIAYPPTSYIDSLVMGSGCSKIYRGKKREAKNSSNILKS
jgi:hypothetical protein